MTYGISRSTPFSVTTTVYSGFVDFFFFFQAEDGIRDLTVTGVQTCALPILGYAVPEEYGAMFTKVREYLGDAQGITLSAHCHDDLGMAVANSLAAIRAGEIGRASCRGRV